MKQKNLDSIVEVARINNTNEFNLIYKSTGNNLPLKYKSIDNILSLMEITKSYAVKERKEELIC